MKTYFETILILIILLSISTIAQTITFEKTHSSTFALQTYDNGYILESSIGDNLYLIRVDDWGNVLWKKTISDSGSSKINSQIDISNNSDIITISTLKNSQTDLLISRINDTDGSLIWSKTVGEKDHNEIGISINETIDHGIALLYKFKFDSETKIGIIKTNAAGSILWNKYYSLEHNFISAPTFLQADDSSYFILTTGGLTKINTSGDSVATFDYTLNSITRNTDGTIIGGGRGEIVNISLDGSLIEKKEVNNNVSFINICSDGSLIYLAGINRLVKTDINKNVLWEISLNERSYYTQQTTDGGFIVTSGSTFLKLDENGNYKSINLRGFTGTYFVFHNYRISWYTHDIDSIDIQYSIDGGSNWKTIISNYPAEIQEYYWTIPDVVSEKCFIMINPSSGGIHFDTNDFPFNIIHYDIANYIAANEIKMWIDNTGQGTFDPNAGRQLYWPGGEDANIAAVTDNWLVIGGNINGETRLNGSTRRNGAYLAGLIPGIILPDGRPDYRYKPEYKIFKIKKNWEYLQEGIARDKLQYDYLHWPAELGAPWEDIDGDGIFNRDIDKPEFIGDEVLFCVANSIDSASSESAFGSSPIPLDIQTTVWGLDTNNELKDVVFKKQRIINKGDKLIEDIYLSNWIYANLGYGRDNFSGCDTSLNLGFTYNGDNDDEGYGTAPPAIGHLIVQGPKIAGSISDSAYYNNTWITGYTNLPLTSFIVYPDYAEPNHPRELEEFYNNQQGFLSNGSSVIDPNNNRVAKKMLSGDPVAKTGWYDGEGWPEGPGPGYRDCLMSSGPFNLEPGDTNEIVYAIIMARGLDNIQSVAELKRKAHVVREYYYGNDITDVKEELVSTPTKFELKQNYPNPFNPATVIEYSVPSPSVGMFNGTSVQLIVYDILSRQVATLVNQHQKPGSYKVEFDASNLASGIYIYQLKAGTDITSKKMVLMK